MPKLSKTKQSTRSGFKKRFDLTNKKVQFFVVIGIFAILGGGYFTVRSFAATSTIFTATPNNGLRPSSIGNNCTAKVSSDSQKSSASIIALGCNASNTPSLAQASTNNIGIVPGKTQACFSVKGGGKIEARADYYVGSAFVHSSRMSTTEKSKINGNAYTRVCTPFHTTVQNSAIQAAIYLDGSATGILAVSNIIIQADSGAPAPAPAPAK